MSNARQCGCPGAQTIDRRKPEPAGAAAAVEVASQLQQWPIQLHLISPQAPYYHGADVLLTADCVAYALGGFHGKYLKGKAIAIACPLVRIDDAGIPKLGAAVRRAADEISARLSGGVPRKAHHHSSSRLSSITHSLEPAKAGP